MKQFLILNLLFFAPSLSAQNSNGDPGPGVPGKMEESESAKSETSQTHLILRDQIPGPFTPDGKKIVTAEGPKPGEKPIVKINVWNIDDGSLLNSFTVETKGVSGVRWTADGTTLVFTDGKSTILWKAFNPSGSNSPRLAA